MAGCGVERVGEARMEDHWEADHKDRLVEEWIYQVSCWGPVARILLRWGGGYIFCCWWVKIAHFLRSVPIYFFKEAVGKVCKGKLLAAGAVMYRYSSQFLRK